MNAVDATEHYEVQSGEETPSLLTVVIDTNPRAWALLKDVLPISQAIANILVFINAHLAFSNSNQVAVIAAHPHRAVWLYPARPNPPSASPPGPGSSARPTPASRDGDIEMPDAAAAVSQTPGTGTGTATARTSANKLPQFAHIESTVLKSMLDLIRDTTPAELQTTTTLISGALTLALAHINKASEAALATSKSADVPKGPSLGGAVAGLGGAGSGGGHPGTHARILVVSVSDSSATQYIPTMNAVFAASHAGVALDVLALKGQAPFLQQGSYITGGTFIAAAEPRGLLMYLMAGFASSAIPGGSRDGGGIASGGPDDSSSSAVVVGPSGAAGASAAAPAVPSLVSPSAEAVDFRAACFCHRRAVDTAFVCSICLSIFCEVPEGAECLTCGTVLALGNYGAKPAVVPRVRKKKKRRIGLNGDEGTASAAGTPRPG